MLRWSSVFLNQIIGTLHHCHKSNILNYSDLLARNVCVFLSNLPQRRETSGHLMPVSEHTWEQICSISQRFSRGNTIFSEHFLRGEAGLGSRDGNPHLLMRTDWRECHLNSHPIRPLSLSRWKMVMRALRAAPDGGRAALWR